MTSSRAVLTTPVLVLMAVATGLCVGGNYFNQPLLDSIAEALDTSRSAAASTVTVAQVAYALGLLFLVPLGDMFPQRRLAVMLMLAAAAGQGLSGFAPNIGVLVVGTAIAGLFSVAAQVLVPFAATLATPESRGRAVGTVMSGLLVGILVARSVAGILAELGDSWTTVYRVSTVAMVIVALALWRVLPATPPVVRQGYGSILRSLGTLIVTHPRLRTRTLLGGLGFASVGALFSTMAFLLSDPPFGLDDLQIGLVGLAGVAGAFAATAAGRLVDRGYGPPTTAVGVFTLIASWAALAAGGSSLVWFVVGMLVVDLALNLVHITNQNIVYALDPDARSRVNSVYMTGYFVGAASGSALGTMAWSAGGWTAVCVLGVGLAALAGVVWALDLRLTARMRARSATATGGPATA
ncbi:MAG: MFS transporter [Rhodococcus sp. (in: high G+C Gram-positive bacteria)]|uniref:Putative MFS family arabinose efflux permease n=1 Tax=Rhodococcus rhodochrous J45 TaxID=935266 RepID=A0A562E6H1_RHORH|nr:MULTISPECIES: MFS transporter [Rhodococcus]MXQ75035.1 MFS transporter [Rhodococcus rhodochrous]TWH17615.1 putative MFS family arabinose efflux permease [Rhodococcus rhodochrous J45]BDB59337.1 MFS transporter [Rhodococcus sp. RDE2]